MPEFAYTARTKEGEIKKGVIEKSSKEELETYLSSRDLTLTQVKEINNYTNFKDWINKINNYLIDISGVPVSEKIFFTQNLSVMIKAGISMSQALRALATQTTNKKLQKILLDVLSSVMLKKAKP